MAAGKEKMTEQECQTLFDLDVKTAVENAKAVVSNFDKLYPNVEPPKPESSELKG